MERFGSPRGGSMSFRMTSKNHLELRVVPVLHGFELSRERLVGRKELAQTNECPHDRDVHLSGAFAFENT
jgi:hypothetical protein